MPLAAGARLGRYQIANLLGAGGMGEVYRARDTRLGRDVAVKILPSAYASDPARLGRFEREVRAAATINHPNILAVYDAGADGGIPFLVTELLEGETLRDLLTPGKPWSVRKTGQVALQLLRGLAAAHAHGIVHRDLKPENIVVTDEGTVKILDFGLARLTEPTSSPGEGPTLSVTDAGTVLGTLGYMAPEQVRGQPADQRADIFAVGVILYELLSGHRAFEGDSPADTMSAILNADPPDFSAHGATVPPGLERIVRRCLEKRPEARFRSAQDLAFALEALSGVSTPSVVLTEPAAPPHGRRRQALIAAGVSLLLGAAAFAIGQRTGKAEEKSAHETTAPTFQRLTFRRGEIRSARFAPDGYTIVYSAAWDGAPLDVYTTRTDSPESRSLALPDTVVDAVSSTGEMAIVRRGTTRVLARIPLGGGAPRDLLEDAIAADWSPDGSVLAALHQVGNRARIEFPVGRVLHQTVHPSSDPLRVSPQGNAIAWIELEGTHATGGSVMIVDLAGKARVLSGPWPELTSLDWTPSGDEVWFTSRERVRGTALHAVTLNGQHRLLGRMDGKVLLQDIGRDGRLLLVRHNTRAAVMARAPGETQERDLSWLDASVGTSLGHDGRGVLIVEGGEGGGRERTTYVRQTDGSPAVRLGDGRGTDFSPDGKWVSVIRSTPPRVVLLPAGAGQPRAVDVGPVVDVNTARFFPDGKRLMIDGNETGRRSRCYVLDLESRQIKAFTPEGVTSGSNPNPVSPDGSFVYAYDTNKLAWYIYPVEGDEPRRIDTSPAEPPLGWNADGRSLYVSGGDDLPHKVYRLHLATNRKTLWKALAPADLAGVARIWPIYVTTDEQAYVYTYDRTLSDLYLATGFR